MFERPNNIRKSEMNAHIIKEKVELNALFFLEMNAYIHVPPGLSYNMIQNEKGPNPEAPPLRNYKLFFFFFF